MERFWSKVDKTEECWNWSGCLLESGYGQFSVKGKIVYAHRFSLEINGVRLIDGMVCDHICRNRKCVNPNHIRQITSRENVLIGEGPSANNSRKSLCKRGHPLSGDNLYLRKRGVAVERICRSCDREKKRKWGARQ
jgi:hypothetical protein